MYYGVQRFACPQLPQDIMICLIFVEMLHKDDIRKNFSVNYVKFDDAGGEILNNKIFSILYMNINSIVSEKKISEFDIVMY